MASKMLGCILAGASGWQAHGAVTGELPFGMTLAAAFGSAAIVCFSWVWLNGRG